MPFTTDTRYCGLFQISDKFHKSVVLGHFIDLCFIHIVVPDIGSYISVRPQLQDVQVDEYAVWKVCRSSITVFCISNPSGPSGV